MDTRTKHLPGDERRAATVEAVVQLAAQQNPSEITTGAIAKFMGVTQGALFKHFPTKESMLEAVMAWVAERLLARIDQAAEGSASAPEALRAIFMTHVEFVAEHPGVPRMLFGELQRAEMSAPKRMAQALLRHYGERLRRVIEQGKTAGQLATDIDVDAAATLFVGMIQGLVMQSLLAGDVRQILHAAPGVFNLYLRAIGTTP